MQLVKKLFSGFVQKGRPGLPVDMIPGQSDLGSFFSAAPETGLALAALNVPIFAGRWSSVS